MKLLERKVVASDTRFNYGVDTFDDQSVVPWMKLRDDVLVGQHYDWVNQTWKICGNK